MEMSVQRVCKEGLKWLILQEVRQEEEEKHHMKRIEDTQLVSWTV